jgi:hypothetical protein
MLFGVFSGTTNRLISVNEVTRNGEAAMSFSADARTIVSAARSCSARFTAASSASPVLSKTIMLQHAALVGLEKLRGVEAASPC